MQLVSHIKTSSRTCLTAECYFGFLGSEPADDEPSAIIIKKQAGNYYQLAVNNVFRNRFTMKGLKPHSVSVSKQSFNKLNKAVRVFYVSSTSRSNFN